MEPQRDSRLKKLKVLVVQGLWRLEVPHKASQKERVWWSEWVSNVSSGGTEVTGDDRVKGITMGQSG